MTPALGPALRRCWRAGAVLGFSGWLAATAAAQHPNRAFDRIRRTSRGRLPIPDWRFFAPEPGQWDDHVLVRVLDAEGTPSPWRQVIHFEPRQWRHAVYFPKHREEKALIDVITELMRQVTGPPIELTDTAPYRLLTGFVEGVVRREHAGSMPAGFQFLVVRFTGHDQSGEIEGRFLSRVEPLG